jgi:hypothetical protein
MLRSTIERCHFDVSSPKISSAFWGRGLTSTFYGRVHSTKTYNLKNAEINANEERS